MANLWDSNFHIAKQWYDKAIAQRDRKQYEKALACFDRALALTPKESEWWGWKGVTLCDINRYEEALACFDRALEIAPDDAHSADYRAFCLFMLDRDEEALAAYDHALTLAPTSGNLWFWKGRTLYWLKRDEEAFSCFERSTELEPDKTERWYWKGYTLRRLKRDEEALSCFERALECKRGNAAAARERAAALYRLQRNEEALSAYEFAIKLAAENNRAEFYYWRGLVLRRLKREQEALDAFERSLEEYDRALARDETHAAWWGERAQVCLDLGRNEEAIVACDRALELETDQAQWWIDRAIACDNLERHDEALADAERAIAVDESNGFGWKLKGLALMHLGRNREALTAFEDALQRIPHDRQTWSNKGMCLYRLGRFDEVLPIYDEAARLNPQDEAIQGERAWAAANIRRTTVDQRLKLRDGRWLGYLDYGDPDGAPIFCFHGTPSSRLAHFADDDLLKELHIRLIVPDRPGYGLSDFQPHRRLLDWPTDVEQLADHLGIQRFAVLGVSGGGPHAAACAYAIPQRLTHMSLISSVPPRESAPLSAYAPRERPSNVIGRYFPWPIQRALYSLLGPIYRRYPRLFLYSVYRRSMPLTAEGQAAAKSLEYPSGPLAPVIRERILEPYRQGARGHAWDIRVCDNSWGFRPEDIHGVEVYLCHGELDPIAPVSAARALAATIPGCHATFYPNEGHALASHMREILTALTSGAAGDQSRQSGEKTDFSSRV